jgi:hypothetical protein
MSTVEMPVEQRYAQLDRAPLPARDAPSVGDQGAGAPDDQMSTQTSPGPDACVAPDAPQAHPRVDSP